MVTQISGYLLVTQGQVNQVGPRGETINKDRSSHLLKNMVGGSAQASYRTGGEVEQEGKWDRRGSKAGEVEQKEMQEARSRSRREWDRKVSRE